MSGILQDQGFPQTGFNRTRSEVQVAIADLVGGGNKPDIKALIDRVWASTVRALNTVPWKFLRVTDDIIIDSTMAANVAAPTANTATGVGVGFVLSSGKTIQYWIEERIKSGDRILQRNDYGLQTVIITGAGAVVKPVITRPTQLNPNATHWALYATATSGGTSSTDARFPHGFEIAEVPIAETTIEDTREGIDPGMPANMSIYRGGEYDLSAPFRNPVRALALDASGQTRYLLSYVPWERWTLYRPFQITTGSCPLWYTIRNWYASAKVTFDPRPGLDTTYPMIRLTYNTPLLPPSGASPDGRLGVPTEIDQYIFDMASVQVRRSILGAQAVGGDELRELRERYYELETQWRDHPDYM